MTTYGTPTSAAPAGNRPARRRLDLPNLVWALAATHLVSRAGGLVRSPMFPIAHSQALAKEITGAQLLQLQRADHGVERTDWETITHATHDTEQARP